MTKKILILTLSLLTINLVLKAQVELISGGTGAAFTLNVPGVFSLRNGIQVTFKAHDNSAVGATIDVNVTGAISIMKDGGTNALSASDIKAGQIVTLVFDGSNWQMMNPVATPPAATNYWSPNGADIFNNNAGNVGIGTNSPTEKLHVTGGQIFNNWVNTNSNIPNLYIRNVNSGSVPGIVSGTLGQVSIVSSDGAENKYAVQGNAGGDNGTKYGIYGSGMGLGTLNYGGYFTANGASNNRGLAAIATASGTNFATGVYAAAIGSGTSSTYGIYAQNGSSVTGSSYAGFFINANTTSSQIYGMRAEINNAAAAATKYGISSQVLNAGVENYAGYFVANFGSTNYGGYFSASGGTNNWAGYFDQGNVYVQNQLNVGTTVAGTNVNVSSTATGGTGLQMENTSAGGKRYRIVSTGSGSVGGAGLFQIYDFDNSAARLTINATGNVGIGTTTPGMIAGATNYLTISSTGPYAAGSIAAIELKGNTNAANSVAARLDFLNGLGTNNTARIEVTTSGGSVGEGRMLFYTNGGSLTEKMRIDEDGNVGIGTTTPGTSLEVNGGVTYSPSSITTTATYTINVGNSSYIRTTTPFGGTTATISNGLKIGQYLIIENAGPYLLTLNDGAANFNIAGNALLYTADTITLIWNGTKWLELSRSDN